MFLRLLGKAPINHQPQSPAPTDNVTPAVNT
jgi:hypothetical protein